MKFDFEKLNLKFSRYQDPEPGKLLISSPALHDNDNFRKTVILIGNNNDEGILGVVVNRTLQMSLTDIFSEVSGWDAPLYLGGPVQKNAFCFIHNQFSSVESSKLLAPGLAWGGSFEGLGNLIAEGRGEGEGDEDELVYKFFLGYAGWERGQLEDEIKEKIWFVCDFKKELVFGEDGVEAWSKALVHLGEKYKLLLKYPESPDLN